MGSGASLPKVPSSPEGFDALPPAERAVIFEAAELQISPCKYDITVATVEGEEVGSLIDGIYRYAGLERETKKPVWSNADARIVFRNDNWIIQRGWLFVFFQHSEKTSAVPPRGRTQLRSDYDLHPPVVADITFTKRSQPSTPGTWIELENKNLSARPLWEWKEWEGDSISVEELKAKVEAHNLSAVYVHDNGYACVKETLYQVKPEHCFTEWPGIFAGGSKLYIYTPPPELANLSPEPTPAGGTKDPRRDEGGQFLEYVDKHDGSARCLRLVERGSKFQCVLEHRGQLAAGQAFVALTLVSGEAIVAMHRVSLPTEEEGTPFQKFAVAVGRAESALHMQFDKDTGFLTCEGNGFVLSARGLEKDGKVDMIPGSHCRAEDRCSFIINDDGTISPKHASHLVMGQRELPLTSLPLEYSEDDVPAKFPLPTMGKTFYIKRPKKSSMYMKEEDGRVVCLGQHGKPWYVSAIRGDGACQLSTDVSTDGDDLRRIRLRLHDDGEYFHCDQIEGSWFVVDVHEGKGFHLKVLKNDLSEEELRMVRQKFDAIDANKDGTIDRKELGSVLKGMNPRLSDNDLSTAFARMDTDGDGLIDFKEYVRMVKLTAKAILDPDAGVYVRFSKWSVQTTHKEDEATLLCFVHEDPDNDDQQMDNPGRFRDTCACFTIWPFPEE